VQDSFYKWKWNNNSLFHKDIFCFRGMLRNEGKKKSATNWFRKCRDQKLTHYCHIFCTIRFITSLYRLIVQNIHSIWARILYQGSLHFSVCNTNLTENSIGLLIAVSIFYLPLYRKTLNRKLNRINNRLDYDMSNHIPWYRILAHMCHVTVIKMVWKFQQVFISENNT
jgi:hypothetical protein